MNPKNEKRPSASETTQHADLISLYDTLPIERKRYFFRAIQDESRALEKVIHFDSLLADPTFLPEATALARAAGIPVRSFAYAVNPYHYESHFDDSPRCRIDRYRTRSGSIDFRVQAFTALEFVHNVIPAAFTLRVLEGHIDLVREGIIVRVDVGVRVEGSEPLTLRIPARARFVYVNHPLGAWISARLDNKGGLA